MNRLRPWYFIVANTAILFVVMQVSTYVALRAYDRVMPALMDPGLSEAVKRNYAHMAPDDLDDLLRVTRRLRFRYAPVMGFMQQATTSKFVNVDDHGIRANGATRRDITALQDAIWFFGGSTAFGDGIADHETIPAQLERMMARPVVNLGVRGYSSTQENLLLNHYLRIGYRPSLAVFLDGINEICEPDPFPKEMSLLVGQAQQGYSWDSGGPVTFAYARIRRKLLGVGSDRDRQSLTCVADGKRNALSTIHFRTLRERQALCSLYEIQCRTLVQPFPGLHGRRDGFETSFLEGDGADLRALFEHLEPGWRATGAIFLTDTLDGYDRHAFIDEIHYSADASRLIAETIASRVAAR